MVTSNVRAIFDIFQDARVVSWRVWASARFGVFLHRQEICETETYCSSNEICTDFFCHRVNCLPLLTFDSDSVWRRCGSLLLSCVTTAKFPSHYWFVIVIFEFQWYLEEPHHKIERLCLGAKITIYQRQARCFSPMLARRRNFWSYFVSSVEIQKMGRGSLFWEITCNNYFFTRSYRFDYDLK